MVRRTASAPAMELVARPSAVKKHERRKGSRVRFELGTGSEEVPDHSG